MMAASAPTLTYFNDNKGRNELTRLIFAIGKVDYVNEEIGPVEYMRRRDAGELPYGQIPTLRLGDGTVLGQSCAIARYAARLASLYPEDMVHATRADAVVDSWRDQLDLFYDVIFERTIIGGKLQMFPRPTSQRAAMLNDYVNTAFRPWLAQMEGQLSSGRVCAPSLCYADLAIYDLVCTIEGILDPGVFAKLMENCDQVRCLVAHVGQLPEVTKHLSQHPYEDIRHLVAAPGLFQRCAEGVTFASLKTCLRAWLSAKGCLEGLRKTK
eukprot:gb/GFBE01062401.1/.p1 GENE.gb/GFBE01062401.1/~~gb/GFBE01062401.1/.p1  ORF type:complete len:268 (+),score=45.95 gb/GFBE01062401.1/:1-804(+)